jgi:hypothetical protein
MNYLTFTALERDTEIPRAPYRGLVFESFTRAISGAPIQNRRAVYHLMAGDCYHCCVADLRALAEASGLVETFGAVTVEDDSAAALEGRAVVASNTTAAEHVDNLTPECDRVRLPFRSCLVRVLDDPH